MFNVGRQIVYTPPHAKGNVDHPDSEEGFITEMDTADKEHVFCRYFNKPPLLGLRTTSCSESTPVRGLVLKNHHRQSLVDELCRKIKNGEEL